MTITERIKLAIKWLIGNGYAKNQKDIGKLLGYKNESSFSQVLNGKVPLPTDFINRLCYLSPKLNSTWIFMETGDMILKDSPTINTNEAQPLEHTTVMNVPLVNQYAYAGYLSGYQDASYLSQLPTLPFIVDHEAQGNYVAFEVKGDSMNDGTEESYIEGDRLLCREIQQHLWCNTKLHIRKWDFVIVHTEGILIKRIIDHNVENHLITIHSLNPLYDDRVLDLCDVRQIFNVVELQRPRRR